MAAIRWHNPQLEGDRLQPINLAQEDNVCALVMESYRRGMDEKIRTGLQSRLRNAFNYQNTDRVDKMVFHAVEESAEEDCTDCDELFSVNLDLIRLQFDTAMSIFRDALKARGDDYSTIDPTPIPETTEESGRRISESAFAAVMRDLSASVVQNSETPEEESLYSVAVLTGLLGTQEGLSRVDEFVTRQRMIETAKLFAEAKKKARNAKVYVDDKLVESNYDAVMLNSAAQSFWYDYSVMYAPYTTKKDTTEIHKGKLRETLQDVWTMRNIHPLNHFFSETTSFTDMGDFEGDVMWMSRNDIKNLADIQGGQKDEIQDVLDEFISYLQLFQGDVKEQYQDSIWEYNDRAPVIRVMIRLSDDQAKELFPNTTIKKGKASHIAELMCVRDRILFKRLYPRYKEYNPYRKNSFTLVDETSMTSGRGLYSLCRTAQEMIDNSLIGVFANMQELNKYIFEVNEAKLMEPDDLESDLSADRPVVKTKGIGNYAQYGGNDRAIHLINVPDNLNSFIATLLQGIALMEKVGFSSAALGNSNFTNVRSAGHAAILQANSNKRFERFLLQQEDYVETPIIDYIWTAGAIGGEEGIVVDSTISVKSYSGFLQNQGQAQEVGLFMQNLVGFMNARSELMARDQDISFFDGLLRQYVDASGFDTADLNITPDLGQLGEIIQPQDIVQAPLNALDGRSNVPDNINL